MASDRPFDRELACAVKTKAGDARQPAHGGQIDHMPAAPLPKMVKDFTRDAQEPMGH